MDLCEFSRILYKLHTIGLNKKFVDSVLQKVALSPEAAWLYATNNEIPFPEGEAAIATNGRFSYEYAVYGLGNERFPAGEAAIINDVDHIYDYTREVLDPFLVPSHGRPQRKRWLEAEDHLFSSTNVSARDYFDEYIGSEGWDNPTEPLKSWMCREFGQCEGCGDPLPENERNHYSLMDGDGTYCSESCAQRAQDREDRFQIDAAVEDAMCEAKPDTTPEEIDEAQRHVQYYGYSGDLTEYLIKAGFLPEEE
jgi:hypothetical protein